MTKKKSNKIISVVHPICCGLDVHKDMVSACIIITESDGEEKFVVQEFSTFTDDLFKLKSWLLNHDCTIVAMESSRVYRRPVRQHPFKELMIEIAWAAVRTKGTYYKDKYHRLKTRRGAKRAVVAIAHRITKAVYHIIKHGKSFVDLGDAYLMSKSTEKRIKALKLRARHLGFNIVPVEAN